MGWFSKKLGNLETYKEEAPHHETAEVQGPRERFSSKLNRSLGSLREKINSGAHKYNEFTQKMDRYQQARAESKLKAMQAKNKLLREQYNRQQITTKMQKLRQQTQQASPLNNIFGQAPVRQKVVNPFDASTWPENQKKAVPKIATKKAIKKVIYYQ